MSGSTQGKPIAGGSGSQPRTEAPTANLAPSPMAALADELVARVSSAVASAQPTPPRGPRRILGLSGADVLRFLAGAAVAIGLAYLGILSAIDDNADAVKAGQAEMDSHEKLPVHPEAGRELNAIDGRLDDIERKTDRIETRQEALLEGIGEIRDELKHQRRRGRR